MNKKNLLLAMLLLLLTSCNQLNTTTPVSIATSKIADTPAPQPQGYVTLWFDDELLSTYEIVYPELEKRGWKGVLAVISDREKAQENSVLSWNQVDELEQEGWEITSHSKTRSRLNEIKSEHVLREEIVASKQELENRGYSIPSFTYPYGQNGLDSGQKLISSNYYYWRSSIQAMNPIPAWRHLTSYSVTTEMTKEDIDNLILDAESGKWIIFNLHAVTDPSEHFLDQFQMLLNAIEDSTLKVVLPHEMFEEFGYAEGFIPRIEANTFQSYEIIGVEDFDKSVSLSIPVLEIDTELKLVCPNDQLENNFSELYENPILICPSSSEYLGDLGQDGASIILGHRQWGIVPKVFAHLDKMHVNDSLSISTDNKNLNYNVKEVLEIEPEELWQTIAQYYEKGTEERISYLLLITCTPYGTSLKRLIVVLERSYIEY